jgi:uncharacterized SAM-binding protein YcdF (DUF218 family)
VYDFAKWFAQPYPVFFLVMGIVLVRLRGVCLERRGLWRTAVVCYVLLWICSTSAFAHLVFLAVEGDFPARVVTPQEGDVIVVLTGDVVRVDARRTYDEPGHSSLYRCHHAARVYHAANAPVIIAGGKVDPSVPGRTNSDIMRDCLVELGVPADEIQIEEESRNTAESARKCKAMLEALSAKRVILVTEAYHMRRSLYAFQSLGLPLEAAPCASRLGEFKPSLRKFLPSTHALDSVHVGLQELLGLVWYRLKGASAPQ